MAFARCASSKSPSVPRRGGFFATLASICHSRKHLARYTHRAAIANPRLVRYHADRVTFRYKDFADQERTRLMTLSGSDFVRRFLLHVLPTRRHDSLP